MKQKIIIVGATSAIAEHCARIWVTESPKDMVLLGRDKAKVERVAQDLLVRSPNSKIAVCTLDFINPMQIAEWASRVCANGVPDIVLIAHGVLPIQKTCEKDLMLNNAALNLNGVSPVLFAEAFVAQMEKANKGKLAIIGSVAGDRGRKSNYVYGAAKGLVATYVQGLQHRLSTSEVKVVMIKPGPTDTPMTAGLKEIGTKLADVGGVAKEIVKGVKDSKPIVYAPGKWAVIMMIIRHLPRFVFHKMDI